MSATLRQFSQRRLFNNESRKQFKRIATNFDELISGDSIYLIIGAPDNPARVTDKFIILASKLPVQTSSGTSLFTIRSYGFEYPGAPSLHFSPNCSYFPFVMLFSYLRSLHNLLITLKAQYRPYFLHQAYKSQHQTICHTARGWRAI